MASKKPADNSAESTGAEPITEQRVEQMLAERFDKLDIGSAISTAVEAGIKARFEEMMPPDQVQALVPGESVAFNIGVQYELRSSYAYVPKYATDGAGAMDLYAPSDVPPTWVNNDLTIDTGVVVAVPLGYTMLVFSRSGHGFNHGTRLANCVGVIDSDYRGTIKVKLVNDGRGQNLRVSGGDRIAQCLLVPTPRIALVESNDLGETARGAGGFGSTGN